MNGLCLGGDLIPLWSHTPNVHDTFILLYSLDLADAFSLPLLLVWTTAGATVEQEDFTLNNVDRIRFLSDPEKLNFFYSAIS
jgi:hypothetical protein